jgi:hypothetical protein
MPVKRKGGAGPMPVKRRGGAGPMHPRRHYRSAPPDTRLPREPGESVGARGFEGGRLRED